MIDLSSLNPPQREAVAHGSGPLLVLAGAGSGKTRVITFRIAHLIERGVDPRHIAALTFTNKAAGEMRERISRLVRTAATARALTMGTFHSLGLQILRSERKTLGFPRGFVIFDASDQLGVVRELLRRLRDGDRRYDAKAILTRISLAKNAFVEPANYQPDDADEYDHITAELYPRYQQALKNFAALDFDDLITETVRLLRDDAAVRDRWAGRFRHVLVDEFQDTNRTQLLLVRALVERHGNLCVVGDDDQSIYSWRGADTGNILGFDKHFEGAHIVKLEQNYRSTPNILAAANAVIGHNADRYGKTLWSAGKEGPTIVHAVAADGPGEAKFVAREIDRLCREEQVPYRECAILYRSNIQTQVVEEELREHRVPYVMFGGQQFFERKEVKDVIAYLRAALNPRDEISLRRIINYPARGIGSGTLERLTTASHADHTPLWNSIARADQHGEIRAGTRRALGEFSSLVRDLDRRLGAGETVPAVRHLIDAIDLYGDIRAASPSQAAAQRRIDNVESLIASLDTHARRNPGRDALSDFLRKLALDSEEDEEEQAGNRVTMTTLHGAKGLEFPVVFLIGMEEELLPHARTLMPRATDVSDPDHASDVSEERRLAYVGITRAMHRLYLCRASHRRLRGKEVPRTPSRFLLEVPEELREDRDVAAENAVVASEDEVSAFFQAFAQQD